MAENVLIKLKRGSASNLPSVLIDGTLYFAQGFSSATGDDGSQYNIFYIDTLDTTNTVVRRPLDAYRAAYAARANAATTASRWATSRTFIISDGTHTGTGTSIDGSQSSYTLNLPDTISANLVGNVTGIADKAKAIVDSTGAYISTANNKPVYFNNGVPTEISGTVAISISGNAATATRLNMTRGDNTHPVYFDNGQPALMTSTDGIGGNDQFIYMTAAGELVESSLTAGSNIQFVYFANGQVTATTQSVGASNKPVYMDNGEIKAIGSSIDATASRAVRLTTDAGSDSVPVYITDGRPSAVDKIDASLIDGVLSLSNIPKGAQERLYIIPSRIANPADLETEFQRLVTNDTLQAGDVFQNGSGGDMYYVYDDNGTLNYAPFTASTASSAATATTATRWATARNFWIGDGTHDGTTRAIDGSGATDQHSSGVYGYRLLLPSEITATTFHGNLDGRATSATKLSNSSGVDYNVGSATIPTYFLNGVPTACTSISLNAATASKWASARLFYIEDGEHGAATTHTSTSVAVDGSANVYLRLPETISANFVGILTGKVVAAAGATNGIAVEGNVDGDLYGNADTATVADHLAHKLSISIRDTESADTSLLQNWTGAADANVSIRAEQILKTYTITMNQTLAAGTWQDLTATSVAQLTTGSYIVQITLNDSNFVNEMFTGVMSWNSSNTSSTSSNEVLLHGMGVNTEHMIFLRTKRMPNNAAPKIQYCADVDLSNATAINFKFRRIL